MIAFTCENCHQKLKVKDELAGKKGQCPHCAQPMRVPETVPAANLADGPTMPPPSGSAAGTKDRSSYPTRGMTAAYSPTLPPDAGSEPTAPVSRELTDFLAPAETEEELGRLGPYRVLRVLGHGGMGVVYKAEDPRLERLVALKAMLPTLAASESARLRFLREAKAAAAVKHDHVVTIYQVDEDRGIPFLAMEFLDGQPLDERLNNGAPLPMEEIVRIGREIAEGLQAAHERGLIHRDIKPANVWLETRRSPLAPVGRGAGGEGRVKILDFGLARATREHGNLTQLGAVIGTPAYMAPEQARGEAVDARCDLFSLGCVLYRMCAGQLPFKGADTVSTLLAVATETPTPLSRLNPKTPPRLAALVDRLLAKKPSERLASASEAATELAALERNLAAEASTASVPVPPVPRARKEPSSATLRQAEVPPSPRKNPAREKTEAADTAFRFADKPPSRRKKPQQQRSRLPLVLAAIAASLLLIGGGSVLVAQIIIRIKGKDGQETKIEVPKGSKVIVEEKGKVVAQVPRPEAGKGPAEEKDKGVAQVPRPEADTKAFFNGTNLVGWEGLTEYWSVKDGALIGSTPGGLKFNTFLCSKKKYKDFELKFSVRLKGDKANSGVQIRSELTDATKFVVKGPQADMGGEYWGSLYGELFGGMMKAAPVAEVAKVLKPDDFNTYFIRCAGKHVTIKVNGLTTVDDEFDKLPAEGIIAWQLHAGPAMEATFRNIEFKDLSAEKGWVQLFNGKDLKGWKVFPNGEGNWRVEDGAITCSGPNSHLFSERDDYKNFHFRLEAKINAKGNSGQYFRTKFEGGFPKGYEAQIALGGGDRQYYTGSLYGIYKIAEELHQPDEWFTQEVIAKGDHIVIKVNGRTVVDLHDKKYQKGNFALQHNGPQTWVRFRKIEVKELPAD
jgi:serine/threonine protein kinase